MSVAVLNGSTVTKFVDDKEAFENSVNECYVMLDIDGDGVLSRDDFRSGFSRVWALEYGPEPQEEIDNLYDTIFERFDEDQNGTIDRDEFGSLMREMMLALARGIGNSLVLVALFQDSLLMKAVEHELIGHS